MQCMGWSTAIRLSLLPPGAPIHNNLWEIVNNPALWAALLGWFVAQSLKVLLTLLLYRRWDWTRFFGSGGMPSSHSAMVMALVTTTGRLNGFASPVFAIALCMALVVMYDAAGVRRAAGMQARVLNQIMEELRRGEGKVPIKKLKELLGHTPVEVLAGALLGIVIGFMVL